MNIQLVKHAAASSDSFDHGEVSRLVVHADLGFNVVSFLRTVLFIGVRELHGIQHPLKVRISWVLDAERLAYVEPTAKERVLPGVQLAREPTCFLVCFTAVQGLIVVSDLDALHQSSFLFTRRHRRLPVELTNNVSINERQALSVCRLPLICAGHYLP